jgi:signal transduction histidine kinase
MLRVRRAPRRRLQRTADVAVALVVALFLAALAEDSPGDPAALVVIGVLAGFGQGAALWWRRAHPLTVFAIAIAGGLVLWIVAPEGLFPYAGLIALGSVAAARPPRVSLPALGVLLGLTALNFLTSKPGDAGFAMAFPVAAWALGEAARTRRVAIAEASRRAVGDEQARIARELHDVIAHSVSVIVVQAAAADDVFDERPDQARAALRSIEAAGREALAELRRLLGAVRDGAGGEDRDRGGDAALAGPQPGLDRLGELADQLRAAGVQVALRHEGDATGTLSPGLELSAYRIVQEALTNTLRHAGASRAEVTVRAGAGRLELDVVDDGAGPTHASHGAGRGIAGMRERAAMLGGTLEAGPRPEGGFRVHASLPLETA